jgi:hypothetical protein
MSNINIPKDHTIIGVEANMDEDSILFIDSNDVIEIQDNTKGRKGTPDYIIICKDEKEQIALNSVAFINIPYKSIKDKIYWK